MRTSDLKYPQCRCVRFGQSRFEPVKRTAIDGKVWWCLYDHRKRKHVAGCKKKKRQDVLVQLAMDFIHSRLPYEPDPGFSKDWMMGRTPKEIADLVRQTITVKQLDANKYPTLEDVLAFVNGGRYQKFFLDHPKVDRDGTVEVFTLAGARAYGKLTSLLYAVDRLTQMTEMYKGGYNMNGVVEELDLIAHESN